MQASFFVRIFASDYVPSEGRAEWLDRHGPQANSALVELSAPLRVWEICGFRAETDGTLPRSKQHPERTAVNQWQELPIATSRYLETYLRDYAREHGHLPPQPHEVGALLEAWLPAHRAEQEAACRAKAAREAEYAARCEAEREAAREQYRAEQAELVAQRRELLQRFGDAEQIERLEAGVLPDGELEAVVAANALASLPAYEPVTADEVRADCDDECSVSIGQLHERSAQPGPMSRREWASHRISIEALDAAALRTRGLTYTATVYYQDGDCCESEHTVRRLALVVEYRIAGMCLSRTYAIG